MDSIKTIQQFGKRAQGRGERIKYLQGKRLTRNESILAHCFDCCGGYCDGVRDCRIETCSLYPYHPYQNTEKG